MKNGLQHRSSAKRAVDVLLFMMGALASRSPSIQNWMIFNYTLAYKSHEIQMNSTFKEEDKFDEQKL